MGGMVMQWQGAGGHFRRQAGSLQSCLQATPAPAWKLGSASADKCSPVAFKAGPKGSKQVGCVAAAVEAAGLHKAAGCGSMRVDKMGVGDPPAADVCARLSLLQGCGSQLAHLPSQQLCFQPLIAG